MEVTPLLKPPPAQEQRSNNIVTALLQAPGTAAAAGGRRQRRACPGLLPSNGTQGGPAPAEAALPRGNETPHREYLWVGPRGHRPPQGASGELPGLCTAKQNLHAARFGAAASAVGCSSGPALPGLVQCHGGWYGSEAISSNTDGKVALLAGWAVPPSRTGFLELRFRRGNLPPRRRSRDSSEEWNADSPAVGPRGDPMSRSARAPTGGARSPPPVKVTPARRADERDSSGCCGCRR
jgi:hypothetical protein